MPCPLTFNPNSASAHNVVEAGPEGFNCIGEKAVAPAGPLVLSDCLHQPVTSHALLVIVIFTVTPLQQTDKQFSKMPLKLGSNWKSAGIGTDMRRWAHGNSRVRGNVHVVIILISKMDESL